jgi:2-iminobutanoate/2-iminopropanoate deaminase
MQKEIIATQNAPAAIGPYSQAVKLGNLVFTAGQVPLIPGTGKLADGDITVQTNQVMRNLQAVLGAAGSSLDYVVKTTVFLHDLGHFSAFNEEYGRFFENGPPARSTVQVAKLPLGALVEIEAIALIP